MVSLAPRFSAHRHIAAAPVALHGSDRVRHAKQVNQLLVAIV